MKLGLTFVVLGYVLSQFYRAFLAVLAPMLASDIGVGADVLSKAAGFWFIAFALMQFPVGWALDTLGPKRTSSVLLGICGAGVRRYLALRRGRWRSTRQ
jgi:sugar phosphate permease